MRLFTKQPPALLLRDSGFHCATANKTGWNVTGLIIVQLHILAHLMESPISLSGTNIYARLQVVMLVSVHTGCKSSVAESRSEINQVWHIVAKNSCRMSRFWLS